MRREFWPGTRSLKVDDQPLERGVSDDVIQKISGSPGSVVKLTVVHAPYTGKAFDLSLTRQVINVETVRGWMRNPDDSWNYLVDPQKKIAYIRVGGFSGTTEADLEGRCATSSKRATSRDWSSIFATIRAGFCRRR